MGWYDLFATFYDRSLRPLYADARASAVAALDLRPGHSVLDCPVGTGLSLAGLADAVGASGQVVGVDLSAGMLAKARAKVDAAGWQGVRLVRASAQELDAETAGVDAFDRIHVFLGMTVFPEPQVAFDHLWDLLRPGGRMVIVDTYAPRPGLRGRMVNLVARADIRRRFWEPLEAVARDLAREDLPSLRSHGGQLVLATGVK